MFLEAALICPIKCAVMVPHKTIPCFSLLQSKDIGVQMHEELVKVTNELYTVSKRNIISLSSQTFLCLHLPACLLFSLR